MALFFVSCATKPKLPLYQVQNDVVYPGKVKKLSVRVPNVGVDHKLICGEQELIAIENNGFLESYFSLDYKYLDKKKKNKIACYIKSRLAEYKNEVVNYHVFSLEVKEWDYPKTRVYVDRKHVDLSKKDLDRFLKEKSELKKVYSSLEKSKKLFQSDFQRPLNSKITGFYGAKRVFNNKKDSWHSGTDFRARRPTPIPASNDGIVVHAKHLFFNGKAVFIDHGMGVLTMYCHLSRIDVKVGDRVVKGQIIGKSGNTGRSSAPHLHWGVRVQNNWIDGLQFLEEQARDSLESRYQSTSKQ